MDFSEQSTKAMKEVFGTAKKLGAHLTFIYPYRLDVSGKREDAVQTKRNVDLKAAKDFEKIAQDLFKGEEITYNFCSEVGFIHDRIEEHARKKNILFAAIQKKFALSKKDVFQELIEKIEVPLMIIP
jgi:hypothetical protein